ncbi:MAG: phosphate butyryltransferase [Bacillota bacterium]|nr:phosphate butyryltransferase [Bacillota bacterium]
MIKNFQQVMQVAKEKGPKRIAVACAADKEVLLAVSAAKKEGIAEATLFGDKDEIVKLCEEISVNPADYEIVDAKGLEEASEKAVSAVSSGNADIVMKGLVDTSIILKAVLNKETGLRTGSVLSHAAVFSTSKYDKLLTITDPAMNIAPDLETKKKIIENVLVLTKAIGLDNPNVAVVCAKEKVSDKMPPTVDAQELVKMNQAGELKGCVVGGPFALDNAISVEAAKHKGVTHPGAGEADILLMPDIEAGNVLYKALSFLAESESAGIILGAKAPIVLTSRADTDQTKLYSIALSVLMAASKEEK